ALRAHTILAAVLVDERLRLALVLFVTERVRGLLFVLLGLLLSERRGDGQAERGSEHSRPAEEAPAVEALSGRFLDHLRWPPCGGCRANAPAGAAGKKPGGTLRLTGGVPPGASPLSL